MSASQSKPKWRRWLREALQLAVILLLVGAAVDWWRAPQQPLQAADTPLQLVDGRSVSLRALSHEQPLVLYFWGSWCGICRHTSPAIDKLARNGHAVLGVALQSGDDAQIDAYLHQHGWQFANLNDKQGDWSRQWQVAATPTIVLVKDGQMRFSTSGISSYWGLRARLWLVSLWPQ